jgi:hypothetical protein
MRDRLLVRHFLWRFVEHDLVSPEADRRHVLATAAGTIVAVSLFMATLTVLKYQLDPFMPPGITSISAIDDCFRFSASAMIVMALVAVAEWDALALDARDTAALGALPIPHAMIVRTKFAATAILAGMALLAWTLLPNLFRGFALPVGLHIGWSGVLRLALAHTVATCGAGIFGFAAVLAIRESAFAALGPIRFGRVSALLQSTLLVGLTTALLLLPAASSDAARKWLGGPERVAMMVPPLWFVGSNEVLAGSVVDDLPRTIPVPYRIRTEREATDLYRRLPAMFRRLHATAWQALAAVLLTMFLACAWNNRRLPAAVRVRGRPPGIARRLLESAAMRTIASTPLSQAGYFFTLQTIARRVSHRVTLAASAGIGVSLLVIAAGSSTGNDPSIATADALPISLLAAQPLFLASLLTAFRHATRIPADLRAGSTFRVAWCCKAAPYVSGVKRAGWSGLVVPLLLVLALWQARLFGARLALLHLGTGLVLAALLMEVLFLRTRSVPFVSSYVPTLDGKSRAMVYLGTVLVSSFVFAFFERIALQTGNYTLFVGVVAAAACSLAAIDGRSRSLPLDIDAEESVLPTQRLNLAG